MQATVRRFDGATRSGSLLFDDGSEASFGAAALDGSGIRVLRFGQRVAVTLTDVPGSGRLVTTVRLLGVRSVD